jgi:predicted transcriptional regulator
MINTSDNKKMRKARSYLKSIIVAEWQNMSDIREDNYLSMEIQNEIENSIIRCKKKNNVTMTLEEIANDVGKSPETIKDYVYEMAKKHGLRIVKTPLKWNK